MEIMQRQKKRKITTKMQKSKINFSKTRRDIKIKWKRDSKNMERSHWKTFCNYARMINSSVEINTTIIAAQREEEQAPM